VSSRYPAGYVRKSVVKEGQPDASREVQLAAIAELAGPNAKVFTDWNVSGNGRTTHKRVEYLRLKDEVRAGRVSVVATYSLSRIGRSLKEIAEFLDLCGATNTRFVTKTDSIDMSTATGRAMVKMLGLWAELESELASERTLAGLEVVRKRGTQLGGTPIGFRRVKDEGRKTSTLVKDDSADHILSAYREAGSLTGAAHLLAERGVKSPRGKGSFSAIGLRGIIERNDKKLLPPRRPSGIRRKNRHALSGIVVCGKCDRVMTPDATHKGLYCSTGRMQGTKVHGAYTAPYSRVLPLIEAEASKYTPAVVTKFVSETTEQRKAITERKARVGQRYEDGGIDLAEYKAKTSALDEELLALGDHDDAIESLTLDPSGVDLTAEPSVVNAKLHTLFRRITLCPSYQAIDVDWKLEPHYYDPAALAAYEQAIAHANTQGAMS
jgi:DNA invertase Pin-like site-specific DNA recombinase